MSTTLFFPPLMPQPSIPSLWPEFGSVGEARATYPADLAFGQFLKSEAFRERRVAFVRGVASEDRVLPRATKRSDERFSILSAFYYIQRPIEVGKFIAQNPEVTKFLFAALPQIKEAWGSDVKSEIDLLEDSEDDSKSLVVRIVSSLPDPYAALDRFDEHWWLANIGRSDGLLNFSVEPK